MGGNADKPKEFYEPETVQDVVDIVQSARAAGRCVRIQGAERSHSWSQFVLTNDIMVNKRTNPYLIREFLLSADLAERSLDPGYEFVF